MKHIIHQTTNYSQFNFLKENREVHPRHLVDSVSKKNLLAEHPIICDRDLNVIDGQHRLKAAEILKLPVFYIVSDNVKVEDISTCQVQKAWLLNDFLKFYSDKPDYKFISEIIFDYKIPIHFAVTCCGADSGNVFRLFRQGLFVIKKNKDAIREHLKNSTQITELLYELARAAGGEINYFESKFRRAVLKVVSEKGYDHERMMYAIKQYPENAIRCLAVNSEAIASRLLKERVYNYRRSGKNKMK